MSSDLRRVTRKASRSVDLPGRTGSPLAHQSSTGSDRASNTPTSDAPRARSDSQPEHGIYGGGRTRPHSHNSGVPHGPSEGEQPRRRSPTGRYRRSGGSTLSTDSGHAPATPPLASTTELLLRTKWFNAISFAKLIQVQTLMGAYPPLISVKRNGPTPFHPSIIQPACEFLGPSTLGMNALQVAIMELMNARSNGRVGPRSGQLAETLAVREEIVVTLIEASWPADLDNDVWGYSNTSLHLAAFHNDHHIMRQLIDQGACATVRNSYGLTPMDVTSNGNIREFLRHHYESTQKADDGWREGDDAAQNASGSDDGGHKEPPPDSPGRTSTSRVSEEEGLLRFSPPSSEVQTPTQSGVAREKALPIEDEPHQPPLTELTAREDNDDSFDIDELSGLPSIDELKAVRSGKELLDALQISEPSPSLAEAKHQSRSEGQLPSFMSGPFPEKKSSSQPSMYETYSKSRVDLPGAVSVNIHEATAEERVSSEDSLDRLVRQFNDYREERERQSQAHAHAGPSPPSPTEQAAVAEDEPEFPSHSSRSTQSSDQPTLVAESIYPVPEMADMGPEAFLPIASTPIEPSPEVHAYSLVPGSSSPKRLGKQPEHSAPNPFVEMDLIDLGSSKSSLGDGTRPVAGEGGSSSQGPSSPSRRASSSYQRLQSASLVKNNPLRRLLDGGSGGSAKSSPSSHSQSPHSASPSGRSSPAKKLTERLQQLQATSNSPTESGGTSIESVNTVQHMHARHELARDNANKATRSPSISSTQSKSSVSSHASSLNHWLQRTATSSTSSGESPSAGRKAPAESAREREIARLATSSPVRNNPLLKLAQKHERRVQLLDSSSSPPDWTSRTPVELGHLGPPALRLHPASGREHHPRPQDPAGDLPDILGASSPTSSLNSYLQQQDIFDIGSNFSHDRPSPSGTNLSSVEAAAQTDSESMYELMPLVEPESHQTHHRYNQAQSKPAEPEAARPDPQEPTSRFPPVPEGADTSSSSLVSPDYDNRDLGLGTLRGQPISTVESDLDLSHFGFTGEPREDTTDVVTSPKRLSMTSVEDMPVTPLSPRGSHKSPAGGPPIPPRRESLGYDRRWSSGSGLDSNREDTLLRHRSPPPAAESRPLPLSQPQLPSDKPENEGDLAGPMPIVYDSGEDMADDEHDGDTLPSRSPEIVGADSPLPAAMQITEGKQDPRQRSKSVAFDSSPAASPRPGTVHVFTDSESDVFYDAASTPQLHSARARRSPLVISSPVPYPPLPRGTSSSGSLPRRGRRDSEAENMPPSDQIQEIVESDSSPLRQRRTGLTKGVVPLTTSQVSIPSPTPSHDQRSSQSQTKLAPFEELRKLVAANSMPDEEEDKPHAGSHAGASGSPSLRRSAAGLPADMDSGDMTVSPPLELLSSRVMGGDQQESYQTIESTLHTSPTASMRPMDALVGEASALSTRTSGTLGPFDDTLDEKAAAVAKLQRIVGDKARPLTWHLDQKVDVEPQRGPSPEGSELSLFEWSFTEDVLNNWEDVKSRASSYVDTLVQEALSNAGRSSLASMDVLPSQSDAHFPPNAGPPKLSFQAFQKLRRLRRAPVRRRPTKVSSYSRYEDESNLQSEDELIHRSRSKRYLHRSLDASASDLDISDVKPVDLGRSERFILPPHVNPLISYPVNGNLAETCFEPPQPASRVGHVYLKILYLSNCQIGTPKGYKSGISMVVRSSTNNIYQTSRVPLAKDVTLSSEFRVPTNEQTHISLWLRRRLDRDTRSERPQSLLMQCLKIASPKKHRAKLGLLQPAPSDVYDTTSSLDYPVTTEEAQDETVGFLTVPPEDIVVHAYAQVLNREYVVENAWGDGVVASVHVQMFYLPDVEELATAEYPLTLHECARTIAARNWHSRVWHAGFLSQQGGDTKYWRRRFFKLEGAFLIAFHEMTLEPRVFIDLSLATRLVDHDDLVDELNQHDRITQAANKMRRRRSSTFPDTRGVTPAPPHSAPHALGQSRNALAPPPTRWVNAPQNNASLTSVRTCASDSSSHRFHSRDSPSTETLETDRASTVVTPTPPSGLSAKFPPLFDEIGIIPMKHSFSIEFHPYGKIEFYAETHAEKMQWMEMLAEIVGLVPTMPSWYLGLLNMRLQPTSPVEDKISLNASRSFMGSLRSRSRPNMIDVESRLTSS